MKRSSQHWHSCTTPPPAPDSNDTAPARRKPSLYTLKPVPFAVQGLITDQLAQMVFNRALGLRPPREVTAALVAKDPSKPNRPGLQVCMDCPPQLLPFHVKPASQLACQAEVPVTEFKSHYTPVLPECPAWCLARPVSSLMDTQSGQVEVRDCSATGGVAGSGEGEDQEEGAGEQEGEEEEQEEQEDAPLLH